MKFMAYSWNDVPNPNESRKKAHKESLGTPKILKKPHNLGPIPGTPENPRKNITILRICLLLAVVCWLLLFRQAVQRPSAGAKTSQSGPHPPGPHKILEKNLTI